MIAHCIGICTFLLTNGKEHLFTYLSAICLRHGSPEGKEEGRKESKEGRGETLVVEGWEHGDLASGNYVES